MWRLIVRSRTTAKPSRQIARSSDPRAVRIIVPIGEESCSSTPVLFAAVRRSLSSVPLASTSLDSSALSEAGALSNRVPVSELAPLYGQRALMKNLLAAIQLIPEHRKSVLQIGVSVDERHSFGEIPASPKASSVHTESVMLEERPDLDETHQQVVVTEKATNDDGQEGTTYSEDHQLPLSKPVIQGRLVRALESRRLTETVRLFDESVALDSELDADVLLDLFQFLVELDVVSAYDCMQRYRELQKSPMEPRRYAKLCEVLGRERPKKVSVHSLRIMVRRLTRELDELDVEKFQHICYPRLVVSLAKQRDAALGRSALPIYKNMVEKKFPRSLDMLERCLSCSRYSRQNELPYHDILREVVSSGRRPYPPTVVQVLLNLFPFTDVKATSVVLGAILELQTNTKPSDSFQEYRVDTGCLEQITVAGARKAEPELNLMVWDVLETLGCQPTEAMFENTIQAFCMSFRQDHNVFAVLADMEAMGFEPSRALIRSISRSLRFSPGRTDHAYYMITDGGDGAGKVTVSSLNAVLSACAELGDVDRAFATFDDFEVHRLNPNSDSFSFLLEGLARSASGENSGNEADFTEKVAVADTVVSMMRENGFPLSCHALHAYVELLCRVGELDKASRAVDIALDASDRVVDKTLFVISMKCGSNGDIDKARHFESRMTERRYFLQNQIDQWEAEMGRHPVMESVER